MGQSETLEKRRRLLELARLRQSERHENYSCVGDFHGGIYECDFVSPWTKSGNNVDARVMVIGQDWASSDTLEQRSSEMASLGYNPRLPTNVNLDDLLWQHFRLFRSECYLTNLFVLIKRGTGSSPIRLAHFRWSARTFTIPEIQIVLPLVVVCLGLLTFRTLMRAAGLRKSLTMEQAIAAPFVLGDSRVHCVAHTGALGMKNRKRRRVDEDWGKLRAVLDTSSSGDEDHNSLVRSREQIGVLRNPSSKAVTELLAHSSELRGIEDHAGNVYLWPYKVATHIIAAGVLNVPYDPATDHVAKLTGKTFYIRSVDDWLKRERQRLGAGSFAARAKHGLAKP